METEAKKIFLSHKGLDKSLVRQYNQLLRTLGYDAWLDEDAMPAGTPLERGLLQGMQESCGVVFFITPSFKDEGFLETEINYAIAEKRDKGDKFSIITLQFSDSNGNKGVIPKLLKQYVWKEPQSEIEAAVEIIRALPISVTSVDWREKNEDIDTIKQQIPLQNQLSEEAKALLLKGAESKNGRVTRLKHSQGVVIGVKNSDNLIPNQEPRTVAKWQGALEELQNYRYLKGVGTQGTIFEVTSQGFKVADTLL